MSPIRVGTFLPLAQPAAAQLGTALARAAEEGVDHVCVGDHVSFFVGAGSDGLITATSLLSLQPNLPVYVALYLLPLRHPVTVARQLASIAELAPGRLTFGVGIGGEDRHEIEVCGVDPRTRGRRMDECLQILRALAGGEPVTFDGELFSLRDALILPAPSPAIPLVVGGRSEAAVRRAGRLGDGWLGIWVSPTRYATVVDQIREEAAGAGRDPSGFDYAINVWCGFGAAREAARAARCRHADRVPDAIRAVRALLALRDTRGGRGIPTPLRRGRLHQIQRDPLRHRSRGCRRRGRRAATPADRRTEAQPRDD